MLATEECTPEIEGQTLVYNLSSDTFQLKPSSDGPGAGKTIKELDDIIKPPRESVVQKIEYICLAAYQLWHSNSSNILTLRAIVPPSVYAFNVSYLNKHLPNSPGLIYPYNLEEQPGDLADVDVDDLVSTHSMLFASAVNFTMMFPLYKSSNRMQMRTARDPFFLPRVLQMYDQLKQLLEENTHWEPDLDRLVLEHSEHLDFIYSLFQTAKTVGIDHFVLPMPPSYRDDLEFYQKKYGPRFLRKFKHYEQTTAAAAAYSDRKHALYSKDKSDKLAIQCLLAKYQRKLVRDCSFMDFAKRIDQASSALKTVLASISHSEFEPTPKSEAPYWARVHAQSNDIFAGELPAKFGTVLHVEYTGDQRVWHMGYEAMQDIIQNAKQRLQEIVSL